MSRPTIPPTDATLHSDGFSTLIILIIAGIIIVGVTWEMFHK